MSECIDFSAIETILKGSLTEAESAVKQAMEFLASAASVTKDHSKLLKEAMDASDKVELFSNLNQCFRTGVLI